MKELIRICIIFIEILLSPITFLSALWLKFIRRYIVKFWNSDSLISKKIFYLVGVFPVMDHYYEPQFNNTKLKIPLDKDRELPGIDFNDNGQLQMLKNFNFNSEIEEINNLPINELNFSFTKGPFGSGDAECLYNYIRFLKPKKIIEVGSGFSTLMAQHAITKNKSLNNDYSCEHICIEPYECLWLEKLPITVKRELVENVDIDFFKKLNENDILFIDSTHMIKPQGDVLFEYLQILPILNKGVYVHIHDIFTPKNYLNNWLNDGILFWNEQYLLEAFLSLNKDYEILGALNYLKHKHFDELKKVSPFLTIDREPGSFWMKRV